MITSIHELVAAHPFFTGLDADAVELAAGCAQNVVFSPGTILLAEGESADTFYLIRQGRVSIEVHAPGRGPIVIETLGPGNVVGWSWLVPPFLWTFDARARDHVRAVAIDGACLRGKAQSDPAFGFALLTRVSSELLQRLQATRIRLLDLYGELT